MPILSLITGENPCRWGKGCKRECQGYQDSSHTCRDDIEAAEYCGQYAIEEAISKGQREREIKETPMPLTG